MPVRPEPIADTCTYLGYKPRRGYMHLVFGLVVTNDLDQKVRRTLTSNTRVVVKNFDPARLTQATMDKLSALTLARVQREISLEGRTEKADILQISIDRLTVEKAAVLAGTDLTSEVVSGN